jgi:hypothetical protein
VSTRSGFNDDNVARHVTRILVLVVWLSAVPCFAQTPDANPGGTPSDKPDTSGAATTPPAPATTAHDSDAIVAAPPAHGDIVEVSGFSWQPVGYVRMQYIAVMNDPNVAFVGRDDGFELQNVRVGVIGHMRAAAFSISLDGAVDERLQVNTPQGKLRVGLRDAFVDIDPAAASSGGTIRRNRPVLRGGFFQTWVDPEALVPDTQREFVDRPIESRGMRATEGWQTPGLTPGRSLGVALRLDTGEHASGFGFEAAIQNGADEYASNNDNDLPALSVAALARLPRGFVVAAARWNARTVGELPFRQDETDLQGSLGVHLDAGPLAIGGGVFVQRTTYQSTGGPSQNAFGGHGQAMFHAGKLGIGYRFGILDPSSLIVTDRVMEHTVGALLAVPSLRMRVQLQITHVAEQAARDLSNDRAQLAAEVSL